MSTIPIQTQMTQQMLDKKDKTPTITKLYALLAGINLVLVILALNTFSITYIGIPFIIISIGLAAKYKHRAAIILGIVGQVFNFPIVIMYYSAFFLRTWSTSERGRRQTGRPRFHRFPREFP